MSEDGSTSFLRGANRATRNWGSRQTDLGHGKINCLSDEVGQNVLSQHPDNRPKRIAPEHGIETDRNAETPDEMARRVKGGC
jgi:hypothetical protein